MEINKDNVVAEAAKFRTSLELNKYLTEWSERTPSVKAAVAKLEPKTPETLEEAKQFCKFCQNVWDALPDTPMIRSGAFFPLCDFASYWLFGQYDE